MLSTIPARRLTRKERAGLVDYPEDAERPRTRGECENGERPCPWVSCKWHLYLDVNRESGAIKLNFPTLEADELAETCTLDVADRGGTTLEQVADLINLTRERVRQLEFRALESLQEVTPASVGQFTND